jgi:hypothetical protein
MHAAYRRAGAPVGNIVRPVSGVEAFAVPWERIADEPAAQPTPAALRRRPDRPLHRNYVPDTNPESP